MSDQATIAGASAPPTSPSTARLRGRRGRWIAVIAALAGLVGVAIGYELPHRSNPDLIHTQLHLYGPSTPDQAAAGKANAIGLVTATRRSDGVHFGDWARTRMTRQCPGYSFNDFDFTAGASGPFGSIKHLEWDVSVTFRQGSGKPGVNCAEGLAVPHPLAVLLADTMTIAPLEQGGQNWLDQFRRGDPA